MGEYSFTILGSSSGNPHPTRATAGYAAWTTRGITLFDCGGGTAGVFLRKGFAAADIRRIIISHAHPDHVCELPLFVQMIHLAGRRDPVTIHVPDEFVAPLQKLLLAMYLIPTRLSFQLTIQGYSSGRVAHDDLSVMAFGNSHLNKYAEAIVVAGLPNRMMCHSFSINIGARRIFYSADIGSFADIEGLLVGHDLCLIESTHADVGQVISYAEVNSHVRIVLTHLGSDMEIAALQSQVDGAPNIELASDGWQWTW